MKIIIELEPDTEQATGWRPTVVEYEEAMREMENATATLANERAKSEVFGKEIDRQQDLIAELRRVIEVRDKQLSRYQADWGVAMPVSADLWHKTLAERDRLKEELARKKPS